MRQKLLPLIFITIWSFVALGTENESILSAPDNWKSERILFPLGFAQEIDFVGFEDLRFAPEWSKPSSENFWSYAFVWYIDNKSPMTEAKLNNVFNLYYDGLMGVNEKNKDDSTKLNKTISSFNKTSNGFDGVIRVYDGFFLKETMTLNIKIKETFCIKENKQIIRVNISPKSFNHSVWKIFNDVKLDIECQ